MAFDAFNTFEKPFASTGRNDAGLSLEDYAKGWESIGEVQPSGEQFNRVLNAQDQKTMWLYQQIKYLAQQLGIPLTASSISILYDAITGKYTPVVVANSGVRTPISVYGNPGVVIPWLNVKMNDGGMLNPQTGKITIPVSGLWEFSGHITFDVVIQAGNTPSIKTYVYQNNVQAVEDGGAVDIINLTGQRVMAFSTPVICKKGDVMDIRGWCLQQGGTVWAESLMCAKLIKRA